MNPKSNSASDMNAPATAAPAVASSPAGALQWAPGDKAPIVELRQYTLHDGRRDELVDLFEREFVESQEALGMKVIGTFHDLDRPNRFVWLRGFTGMDSRLVGLDAFYSGPVWKAHREAANATMADSDDVLLLHAPDAAAEFRLDGSRPALGEPAPHGLIVATIYYLKTGSEAAVPIFEVRVKPLLDAAGAPPIAWFVPEIATNNFPRLPVREGEKMLVWFARFHGAEDHAKRKETIDAAAQPLAPFIVRTETLRLEPTSRSQLR